MQEFATVLNCEKVTIEDVFSKKKPNVNIVTHSYVVAQKRELIVLV